MLSPDGRVRRVNRCLCALLGRAPAEVVGRSILEFTHPDDIAESVDWTASRFGGIDRPPLVKRYLRADGSIVHAMVTAAVVAADTDEPYIFGQVQDITELRRAALQKAGSPILAATRSSPQT